MIKIDVEGAEHLVLKGGRETLRTREIDVIAEFNPKSIRDAGLTPAEYLRLYTRKLGYTPYRMHRPRWGWHRWRSLHPLASVDDLPLTHESNLVFLKRPASVAARG